LKGAGNVPPKRELSQHEKTLLELARYDRGSESPLAIKNYRALTEDRVTQLLSKAGGDGTLDKVKCFVFEAWNREEHRTYLSLMLTWLDCDIDDLNDDTLQVIQDAWNYLPHRELDGRCPAEVMAESMEAGDGST
jgi:hypothetical protein